MSRDPRYTKAEQKIQYSFLQLLNKNQFEQITIDKIIKNANISRGTFYHHYQDKYDLVEKMQAAELANFKSLLAKRVEKMQFNEQLDISGLQQQVLTSLQKSRKLSQIKVGQRSFTQSLFELVEYEITSYISNQQLKYIGNSNDLAIASHLLTNVILSYVDYFKDQAVLPSLTKQKQTLQTFNGLLTRVITTI
ncbi:TetR/AcrR family transcriptional regulator [Lactobacillus sp. ESL0681]|uniref:TetR/AcrR family transcriptional regulator n=1 Tax=Lactobacillus sp. ESL0681 TaxID=2983211 RepID=UPI0023F96930|nr:TetR/AcrR family transcriptional regulator [Lactobacillus sp. ESL0681]WEV40123.1 TetR/AcrR family transcriptional regulator [Lactobacillus sp. ESL0681]